MTAYRERLKAGEHDANNPNRNTEGTTTSQDLAGTTGQAKQQVKASTKVGKRSGR